MITGHKKWCIPDLYMVENEADKKTPSHETICFFNSNEEAAKVDIFLYFEGNTGKKEIRNLSVQPYSSMHFRMDEYKESDFCIPRCTPYSMVIVSDKGIVVEYARLNWIDGNMQSFAVIPYYED